MLRSSPFQPLSNPHEVAGPAPRPLLSVGECSWKLLSAYPLHTTWNQSLLGTKPWSPEWCSGGTAGAVMGRRAERCLAAFQEPKTVKTRVQRPGLIPWKGNKGKMVITDSAEAPGGKGRGQI